MEETTERGCPIKEREEQFEIKEIPLEEIFSDPKFK